MDNYDRFLAEYPASEFAAAARKRTAELERDEAWEATVDENTVPALEGFLQNYPSAPQRPEAEKLIAALLITDTSPDADEGSGNFRVSARRFSEY